MKALNNHQLRAAVILLFISNCASSQISSGNSTKISVAASAENASTTDATGTLPVTQRSTFKATTPKVATASPLVKTTTRAKKSIQPSPPISLTKSGGSFESICVTTEDCQSKQNLQCFDGVCRCEFPQVFDILQQKCITPLGKECNSELSNEENMCPEFAECFLDSCVCKKGYSMHTLTRCKSDASDKKTIVLWPRQSKQDNSDKISCTPSTCDESKGLMCQVGGACTCKNTKEIFVDEFGRCLNTAMQKTLRDTLLLVNSSEIDVKSFKALLERFQREGDQDTGSSNSYSSPIHKLVNILDGSEDYKDSQFTPSNMEDDFYEAEAQEPVTETAMPEGIAGKEEGASGSVSSPTHHTIPIASEQGIVEPLTHSRESGESIKKPESTQNTGFLPLDNYQPQPQEPSIVQRQAPPYGSQHQQGLGFGGGGGGHGGFPAGTSHFPFGFGGHGGGQHHGLGHHGGGGHGGGHHHGLGHHGGGGHGGAHGVGYGDHGHFGHPYGFGGHGLDHGHLGHGLDHGHLGHHGLGGHGLGHGHLGHQGLGGHGLDHGHFGPHHGIGGHGGFQPSHGIGHHGGGGGAGGGHHQGHHPGHHGGHLGGLHGALHHNQRPHFLLDIAEFIGGTLKLLDRLGPIVHVLNDAIKKGGILDRHRGPHGMGMGGGGGGGGLLNGQRGRRFGDSSKEDILHKEDSHMAGFMKFVGVLMRIKSKLEESDNEPLKKLLL